MEPKQTNLIKLIFASQDAELTEVKKSFSDFPKYFFNYRRNICIVYDRSTLYIIHKESIKVVDIGKPHTITDLAYNYERSLISFLTVEGVLYLHYANSKTQSVMRKDALKVQMFEWVYSVSNLCNFFTAEDASIRLYKLEDDKKGLKEIKCISCKSNFFLYEPNAEMLVVFPTGDCKSVHTYVFEAPKYKNWFKSNEIAIEFEQDQCLLMTVKKYRSLCLEGSRLNKEIFTKRKVEEYFIDVLRMHNMTYLLFYFSNEGKLKLYPLEEGSQSALQIKLPSDALLSFNVVDNMLVVHLRNERITFIYDINPENAQILVSPFPLGHEALSTDLYQLQFVSKRAISPEGRISKWAVSLPVIQYYLKAELQVFDFLNKRTNSKMVMLRWLRQNLFNLKQIYLSRIWKSIFLKTVRPQHDEADTVSLLELYTNIFYTLSMEPLVPKEMLASVLLECLRQAMEYQISIPMLLQHLAVTLLLDTGKHELLAYLCYNGVFEKQEQYVTEIFSHKEEVLQMLALDIASQVLPKQDMFSLLMRKQRVREAKRFMRIHYEHIEVLYMISVARVIEDKQMQREYLNYAKFFIAQKFPTMNEVYISEEEHKVLAKESEARA